MKTTTETLLENLLETVQIDNLDLQYFIENSGATTFEELEEYIRDNNGFDVEIIYYYKAMEFLKEHDQSLSESIEIAVEFGFELSSINSEVLASLLASKYCEQEFYDYQAEIEEYYNNLEELTLLEQD